jgi:arsenite methyltransferase
MTTPMLHAVSEKLVHEGRAEIPLWLEEYLGSSELSEGSSFALAGERFTVRAGIPRSCKLVSHAQAQTSDTFGFKWKKRETFDSAASLGRIHEWLIQRYGDVAHAPWLKEHGEKPLLLDAGCGAGMSGLQLFGSVLPRLRYLGVDICEAVDVAKQRFSERGLNGGFIQADIVNLPFAAGSIDLIFAEGVLHHTDSTERTLMALAKLLKRGGRFLFYVYRRKGPLREFADDYIRTQLKTMPPDAAWRAMQPLTQLGVALGELKVEINVPEAIDLLGIPAGRYDVQRLFYWHVAKAFYRADLTFDEMNHINFDWYAPTNAHRHSPEEVRRWCVDSGLHIEREVVEESGITCIARKT